MNLTKNCLAFVFLLFSHWGFALEFAVPTEKDYQKAFAAADWVAKIEILSVQTVPVLSGKPTIAGMPPELKLSVAVKSLLRADAKLPLALFDEPITISTNYLDQDLTVGVEFYVFANKHPQQPNGWYAIGRSKLGLFSAVSLAMGEPPPSLSFILGWLNSNHPQPSVLPLDQTPGLALILNSVQKPPLDGWFLIRDTARAGTPALDAAFNPTVPYLGPDSKAIYLGPAIANPKGAGYVFPYLADSRFVKASLSAGFYRLLNSAPLAVKVWESQHSVRIQLKRTEITEKAIFLKALEGDAAVAAMCPVPPGSRAYFEGEKASQDSHDLINHRLFLHARVEGQGDTYYDSKTASYQHHPSSHFSLQVLGWHYGAKKPSADQVMQQGLGRASMLYFADKKTVFAGQHLLGQSVLLEFSPHQYSYLTPRGALPSGHDPRTKNAEEFVIAVMPNHSNPDLSLSGVNTHRSQKPEKSVTDRTSEPLTLTSATKSQTDIAALYLSGQARLHSYLCFGWVRVKNGMLIWTDAPPEPLSAYFAKRAQRITHAPKLTQSLSNYRKTFTEPSTEAFELDLAGWR